MINTFEPRLDVLPLLQRQLWPRLQPTKALGLTLYGGTAIALRLGHRLSIDFDFFSEKPLDKNALRKTFAFMKQATILQDELDTLKVLVPVEGSHDEGVVLSFFGGIDFGRVGNPDVTNDGVLYVASLEDLMATKLAVILKRVTAKDYIDIAAMIKAGASLSSGLGAARALYGSSFQPSESLKALVYFKGGDLNTLTIEDKTTLVEAARMIRDVPQVTILARSLTPTKPRRT